MGVEAGQDQCAYRLDASSKRGRHLSLGAQLVQSSWQLLPCAPYKGALFKFVALRTGERMDGNGNLIRREQGKSQGESGKGETSGGEQALEEKRLREE